MKWIIRKRIRGHKLLLVRGAYAWELQVSRLVLQFRHRDCDPTIGFRWFRAWLDPYGYCR